MPITQASFDNIKVGYISETDGYVKGVSIADANAYAELNPETEFIFHHLHNNYKMKISSNVKTFVYQDKNDKNPKLI